MINPAAIGVALLILLAATTTVGSSSAKQNYSFKGSQPTLSNILSSISLKDVMQSYQQQTNTISLNRDALAAPHWLTIKVPSGTSLQGTIVINNEARIPLDNGLPPLDLSPYLEPGLTQVSITGTFAPTAASASIQFEGPDTMVQQRTVGTGEINYQLNLVVE
jgi:hypothetical protein